MDVNCLLWANNTIVEINTLSKEELMQLINIITDAKHAFVIPEVFKIITADPLLQILVFIMQMCLETCSNFKSCCELIFRDHSVAKEFQFVFLFLEKIL